jgi:hypothetical protein
VQPEQLGEDLPSFTTLDYRDCPFEGPLDHLIGAGREVPLMVAFLDYDQDDEADREPKQS